MRSAGKSVPWVTEDHMQSMIADIQEPDVVASIIEKRRHPFRIPRARDAFCDHEPGSCALHPSPMTETSSPCVPSFRFCHMASPFKTRRFIGRKKSRFPRTSATFRSGPALR